MRFNRQNRRSFFPSSRSGKRTPFARRRIFLFFWIGVLTVLGLVPLRDFNIGSLDKILHALFSFITVVLFFTGSRERTIFSLIFIGFLVLVCGILIEMIQGFIPGRTSNPYDVLANFIGIAVAVFFLAKRYGKA